MPSPTPEAEAVLSLIDDEPTTISLNGDEVKAYVGTATLVDDDEGARIETRQVAVSGSPPAGSSVIGMGGKSYTVDTITDYNGAWTGEMISER